MLPVIISVNGVIVLITLFLNSKITFGLFFDESRPFGHFDLVNFLFSVHENDLLRIKVRIAQIAQLEFRYDSGIVS